MVIVMKIGSGNGDINFNYREINKITETKRLMSSKGKGNSPSIKW